MKSKDTHLLGVEITEEMRTQLRKFAYLKGISVSAAVRYILDFYFKKIEDGN